ncbi:MAG: hypothetical protein R3E39_28540 [Anaerolineae bacterium]
MLTFSHGRTLSNHIRFAHIKRLLLASGLLLLAACGAQTAPTSTVAFTLVPSLTASSAAEIQEAVNGTVTALAVADIASPTPPPDFTLTPEPTIPVTQLPPVTGDKIPPPFDITLPDGWKFDYNAQILPDVEQGNLIAIPVAAYGGPITGGTGTIVVYWGFPNLVTPTQEDLAQAALGVTPQATPEPDLWSDGVRLLRSGIVESDCNIGVDVRRSFRVGLLSAVGTQWSAVGCTESGLPDTRGWFAGVREKGINFVFYVFGDPITVMDTSSGELQAILDSVRFRVLDVTVTPASSDASLSVFATNTPAP